MKTKILFVLMLVLISDIGFCQLYYPNTSTTITGSNVGIGVSTPTNILSFGNTQAQTIWIENTSNTVAGRALTLQAGSTVTGGTADMVGGNLILNSGLGKGTGASNIVFSTGKTLTTGSTLQTLTEAMRITGSGKVGIGTAAPVTGLHIYGTGLASSLTLQKLGSSSLGSYLYFGSINSPTAPVGSGNQLGAMIFTGPKNTGATVGYGAYISSYATEDWDSGETKSGAKLTFGTTPNGGGTSGGGYLQRMVIDNNGYVGIGETSPSQILHVLGNMRLTGAIYDVNNEAGTNGQILKTTGTGIDWVDASTIGDNLGNHTCTQNLKLSSYWLSNDGGDEGININDAGDVYVGSSASGGTSSKFNVTNTTRGYGIDCESSTTSGMNNAIRVNATGAQSGNNNAAITTETEGANMYNYGVDTYVHGDGIANTGVSSTVLDGDYNFAGIFNATSATGSPTVNYGIKASASNATTNWAGYFSGDVYTTTNYYSSDKRFKKDIAPIDGAIYKLKNLQGVSYKYKVDEFEKRNFNKEMQFGFIAQDLQKTLPNLVKEDEEGYLCVNYVEVIPILTEAIKEQQKIIEQQDSSIEELQSKINDLSNQSLLNNQSINGNTINTNCILYQNNPNPFSKNTEIRYSLSGNITNASIILFDMNGKTLKAYPIEIKTDGLLIINAAELNSGMYFYSLITNGKEVSTKRMIITE